MNNEEISKKIDKVWGVLKYCGFIALGISVFSIVYYFINKNIQDGVNSLNIIGAQLSVVIMQMAIRGAVLLAASISMITECIKKNKICNFGTFFTLASLISMSSGSESYSVYNLSPFVSNSAGNVITTVYAIQSISFILGIVVVINFIRLIILDRKLTNVQ